MATNYINSPIDIYIGPSSHFRDDDLPLFRRMLLPRELQRDSLVPKAGLEPARPEGHDILSVGCLPFHHLGIWLRWLDSNQRNATVKVSCLITWLHLNMVRVVGFEPTSFIIPLPKRVQLPSYATPE